MKLHYLKTVTENTSNSPFSFDVRIPELDGIRGTAILVVVIYHWFFLSGIDEALPYPIASIGLMGWSGVDLFFVLSGFLIGGILIDNRDTKNYFKVFYIRRFYRIIPLYVVMVTVWIILSYLSATHSVSEPRKWLFEHSLPFYVYPFFIQNIWMALHGTMGARMIDATWSLAVEEQFYLTLPFIIRYVKYKNLPIYIIAGILLAPIIRVFLYFTWGADNSAVANYVLLFCRLDSLLLGVLAAWFVRRENGVTYLQKHKYYLTGSAVLLGIFFLALARIRPGFNNFYLVSFGYTLIGLFYLSLLLIAISSSKNLISKIFRFRGLTFLGILAYGLYLLHQPILGMMHGAIRADNPYINGRMSLLVTCLSFVVLLFVSYMSWIFFEKPLVKLSHKYKYIKNEYFNEDYYVTKKLPNNRTAEN